MRDAEKTIGKIIDKQSICFISSIDADGFPNTKAMLKGFVEVLEDQASKDSRQFPPDIIVILNQLILSNAESLRLGNKKVKSPSQELRG